MPSPAVLVADRTRHVKNGAPFRTPPLAELERLRHLRALGFSQQKVASDLGWPVGRVRRWWRP
jgi:hypothetical protein